MKRILLLLFILVISVGQACAAVTSPLAGLNFNGVSVKVVGPSEYPDVNALNLYALNVLSQMGVTVGNSPAPDAALVIEFGVGSSIKLYELVTGPRGFKDRLATWEMGAAQRDLAEDPKDVIRQYLQVFVDQYRVANGITQPGPSLTLNGNGNAITVARGATITAGVNGGIVYTAISPYVWPDCLTLTSVNDTAHLGFAWAAQTVSFTAPASPGAYAVRYWKGCATQTAISPTVTVQ
jgi:hypothetical protein